jgi:hypothetical protein
MRLSHRLVLQVVDDDRLVLVDDRTGYELALSVVEAGRLAAGISWFATNGGAKLSDALTEALQDATVIAEGKPR